jgi:hypothetical protein
MAREIKLKIVKLSEQEELNYCEAMKTIVKTPNPGQGGFGIDDIRKCNRILKVLESVKGLHDKVIFEEEDYKYLNGKVQANRWGMPHEEIEKFVDSIASAKEVDLNLPKAV